MAKPKELNSIPCHNGRWKKFLIETEACDYFLYSRSNFEAGLEFSKLVSIPPVNITEVRYAK